eukprot:5609437-Amphidinium_carterae.1
MSMIIAFAIVLVHVDVGSNHGVVVEVVLFVALFVHDSKRLSLFVRRLDLHVFADLYRSVVVCRRVFGTVDRMFSSHTILNVVVVDQSGRCSAR